MDAAQILDRLAFQERLPVEAIRAAEADRASVVPVFLNAIEQYLSDDADPSVQDSLFFIFHLLGSWREKSAYRPLARLLRCPDDDIDAIFGDSLTETSHRVMAGVFDGDPNPLYDVILDSDVDEFIRSRMCEVIAMVTLRGEIPRAEAVRFLSACYSELKPQEECFVWHGWQSAIALIGLGELKPLVEQAFARGSIHLGWLGFDDFEQDLQQAIDDPAMLPRRYGDEYTLFGDTIEELSTWNCFSPKDSKLKERSDIHRSEPWLTGPAINQFKDVGRNDPCPCGSGKKFKKCCLAADVGPPALQAM